VNRPSVKWITVFGLGHMWPASGTWGSLPPVVVAGLMLAASRLLGCGACPDGVEATAACSSCWWWLYSGVLGLMCLVFSYACIAQGDGAEARFGEKDPSEAVADETAGQCLPLLALPLCRLETAADIALGLLTAFVAFRAMDILKPPPARGLQRIAGGWGILIDDLLAGVYAAVITAVVVRVV
jgi:phosphatidylglycerophosphatase A